MRGSMHLELASQDQRTLLFLARNTIWLLRGKRIQSRAHIVHLFAGEINYEFP